MIRNLSFFFSLVLFLGCSSYKKFTQLSRPEKKWVITHLFVAKKALKISESARKKSKEMEVSTLLDSDSNGGQVDAFRHSYWMANLAREINPNKARKLGEAHEKGNEIQYKKGKLEETTLPDKVSVEMDLYNNEIGIYIGVTEKGKLDSILIERIKSGAMRVIKKDCNRNSVDSLGNVIPLYQWQGKWENNRTIVPSNYNEGC